MNKNVNLMVYISSEISLQMLVENLEIPYTEADYRWLESNWKAFYYIVILLLLKLYCFIYAVNDRQWEQRSVEGDPIIN